MTGSNQLQVRDIVQGDDQYFTNSDPISITLSVFEDYDTNVADNIVFKLLFNDPCNSATIDFTLVDQATGS